MKSLFLFASMERKQETSSLQNESLGFNLVNYFWNTCWSKNHSSLPLWARKAINLAKNCALLHLLETPTKFLLWSTNRVIEVFQNLQTRKPPVCYVAFFAFCLRLVKSPSIPLAFQDAENSSGISSKSTLCFSHVHPAFIMSFWSFWSITSPMLL